MADQFIILTERTRFGGETGAGLMRNRCAFTSKDMADEFGDAFTYAIVMGWHADPDDPEDDGGAMREQAAKWGWDEEMVAWLIDAHARFAALPDRHPAPDAVPSGEATDDDIHDPDCTCGLPVDHDGECR